MTALSGRSFLQANLLHDQTGGIASDERIVTIMESLVRDHPEVTKYQQRLAASLKNLGGAYETVRQIFPG